MGEFLPQIPVGDTGTSLGRVWHGHLRIARLHLEAKQDVAGSDKVFDVSQAWRDTLVRAVRLHGSSIQRPWSSSGTRKDFNSYSVEVHVDDVQVPRW